MFQIKNVFSNLHTLHRVLLSDSIGLKEIRNEMNKTICSPNEINLQKLLKNIYKNIFFGIENLLYLGYNVLNFQLLNQDNPDNKYIEDIMKKQDLNMIKLRTKTEKVLNINTYNGVMKWIAGNCWSNPLITNRFVNELDLVDIHIINSIR